MDKRIGSVVIVGGGTAGWMTAAALASRIGRAGHTRITLIESDQIGTVGVGEATVPAVLDFLRRLDIDETDFVAKTNATFKLAIRFDGWAGEGSSFHHPFADIGVPINKVPFQAMWTKLRQLGRVGPVDDFSMGSWLAREGRFAVPVRNAQTGSSSFNYALHFDATLAATYLSSWSRINGVERIEGTISQVIRDGESGDVASVVLENGEKVAGDLFIDCSGFRGLLIEQALETGYDDWTHWLPCDRAIAVASETRVPRPSFTRARAGVAGWQWRIPLQHRTGNGHVFCSKYLSEDEAASQLLANLDGQPLGDPRPLRFRTGIRKKFWNRNVYAIGLSAGFLEPLESTGIYLIQTGIAMLLSNFPSREPNDALVAEVNRSQRYHWERVRDFIIMHYWLNRREGEPFWEMCREMTVPDELAAIIELFKRTGRLRLEETDFFQSSSWHYMLTGLGLVPDRYHPSADDFDESELVEELGRMSRSMRQASLQAQSHDEFIKRNCAAPEMAA